MKRFLRLLRKDLEASKMAILINCGLTLAWIAFLRTRLEATWPLEAIVGLLFVPIAILPLWFVWQSFQSLRSEWREDTAYTLLLLPVPGWQITLSKLVALLIEITAVFIVFSGGVLLIFQSTIQIFLGEILSTFPISWMLRNGFLIYLTMLALLATFIVLVQLAFFVAKLVGRLQGIVMFLVFILSTWLVDRIGTLLQPVFRWLPEVSIDKLFDLNRDFVAEYTNNTAISWNWDISADLGSWLAIIGLFVLSSWIFENFVEINE